MPGLAKILDREGFEMTTTSHVLAVAACERGDVVPTSEAGTYRFASSRPVTSATPEQIATLAYRRAQKAKKEAAR